MIDGQQQEGLDQLRFNGRGADGENGLLGENRRSLGDGPDVAGKVKMTQIRQKFLGKQIPALQIRQVLGIKMQILDVVDDLLQPGCDGEAAVIRTLAKKHVKIANTILQSALKIPVSHGQLIKIAEHGQVQLFFGFHSGTSHPAPIRSQFYCTDYMRFPTK